MTWITWAVPTALVVAGMLAAGAVGYLRTGRRASGPGMLSREVPNAEAPDAAASPHPSGFDRTCLEDAGPRHATPDHASEHWMDMALSNEPDVESICIVDIHESGAFDIVHPSQADDGSDDSCASHLACGLLGALLVPAFVQRLMAGRYTSAAAHRPGNWYGMVETATGPHCIRAAWSHLPVTKSAAARVIIAMRDTTEAMRIHQFGRDRERDLRTLVENCPDPIVRYDRQGKRIFTNPAHARVTGIPLMAGLGKTPRELGVFDEPAADAYEQVLHRVLRTGQAEDTVVQVGAHAFSVRIVPERDANGSTATALAIAREIAGPERTQQRLSQLEQRYRMMIDHSSDAIARHDASFDCVYANPVLLRRFGHAMAARRDGMVWHDAFVDPTVIRDGIARAFGQDAHVEIDAMYRTVEGSVRRALVKFEPDCDAGGTTTHALVIVRESAAPDESHGPARESPAVGPMANEEGGSSFDARIGQAIDVARREGSGVGLVLLSIEPLAEAHVSPDKTACDRLRRAILAHLGTLVAPDCTAEHLGGDAFAILNRDVHSRSDVHALASHVQDELCAPLHVDGTVIDLSTSAGFASYPWDADRMSGLFESAHAALCAAIRRDTDARRTSNEWRNAQGDRRYALARELRGARERGEFELYYQPVVMLATEQTVGAEALLRWNHPEFGLVMPDEFIAIAERQGHLDMLGDWILETACSAVAEWNRACESSLRMSVNLSCRQFSARDLAASVERVLTSTGCRAEWLMLEMTESTLLDDVAQVHATLARLRALGVAIAIDDFGTGYSAMNYLHRFSVDVVKIDRSFVRDFQTERPLLSMVRAIATLADALGLSVIVEGVETTRQADRLIEIGCRTAQGYLFGRPMSKSRFEAYLERRQVAGRFR